MKKHHGTLLGTVAVCLLLAAGARAGAAAATDLWQLARQRGQAHRFSTLFSAQDVQSRLGSEEGLKAAVDWCKKTADRKSVV